MRERINGGGNVVDAQNILKDFRRKRHELARSLNMKSDELCALAAATGILVFQARAGGNNIIEITFDEKGLPSLKGYNKKTRPIV
jgi:hypothetical protein